MPQVLLTGPGRVSERVERTLHYSFWELSGKPYLFLQISHLRSPIEAIEALSPVGGDSFLQQCFRQQLPVRGQIVRRL